MRIHFYGGVEHVTGSNFLLEEGNTKILIDCGLVQKERFCSLENFLPFPYKAEEIKAVLVTHAHLDHLGRLPKLIKEGFRGYIYSTLPTKDLAYEILLDSQKLIEENCQELNKDNLYDKEDLDELMSRWQTLNYHQKFKMDNFEIEFYDAGHILGSAFIKINNLVFSGDLGNQEKSLVKELEPLPEVNYLVLESTYGDRIHENLFQRKHFLERILEKVIYEKRTLIIPTFALERAQEIIFDIQNLIEKRQIPEIKIFLDSPLAYRISQIYEKYPEYLNEKIQKEILAKGIFKKESLKIIEDLKEEKEMFSASPPKIILAGSGMVTGGRMIKILERYKDDPLVTLLFVGYQAEGSLGRKILEGEEKIKGEVLSLFSYSAHRDQEGILEWLKPQRFNLKKIFLTHGEEKAKMALKTKIMDELAIETVIPKEGEIFEVLG